MFWTWGAEMYVPDRVSSVELLKLIQKLARSVRRTQVASTIIAIFGTTTLGVAIVSTIVVLSVADASDGWNWPRYVGMAVGVISALVSGVLHENAAALKSRQRSLEAEAEVRNPERLASILRRSGDSESDGGGRS